MVLFAIIILVTASSYTALFWWLGLHYAAVGCSGGILAGIDVLRFFRRRFAVTRAAHELAASTWVAVVASSWETGGIGSSVVPWLLAGPMIATLIASRHAGLVWVGFGALAIGAFHTLEKVGISPPVPELGELEALFDFAIPVGLVGFAFAVTWTYDVAQEEATRRLDTAMRTIESAQAYAERAHAGARAILDNVAQGLVLVGEHGTLRTERSSSLDAMFGAPSPGDSIWDIFGDQDAEVAERIEVGWEQLTSGWLPIEVALDQLPRRITASDRTYDLSWEAVHGNDVLLVATDATDRLEAEARQAEHEELAGVVYRLGRNRAATLDFFREARRIVEALENRHGSPEQERRWVHTLKGSSAVMGLGRLAAWLHGLETAVAREGRAYSSEERASLVERWNVLESRLGTILGEEDSNVVHITIDELGLTIRLLEGTTPRARIAARMKAWGWDDAAPRLAFLAEQAERIAHRLDKSIEVVLDARGTRTPPTDEWRALWASLVHVVRNAIDHGVEPNRAALGKAPRAVLELSARAQDGFIHIEIRDDGAGIDWHALESSAPHPLRTHEERIAWLFKDGSSSRKEVTDLSGRGVGTAAVLEAVKALDGTVDVQSERGGYTRFIVRVPLRWSVDGLAPIAAMG